MKFSQSTISILKSFSNINTGIHFRKGNVLTSVHPQKVIMGQAIIEDTIPQDFVIYNLNTFLGVVSLLKDPSFDFKKDKVVIKSGETSINYTFADPSTVKAPPEKEIKLVPDVSIELSNEEIEAVKKAAAVMELDLIKIESEGDKVSIVAYDAKDPSSNTYRVETKSTSDRNFSFVFKVANLQLVPGSYDVEITNNTAGHFMNKSHSLQYWIALEKDSRLS